MLRLRDEADGSTGHGRWVRREDLSALAKRDLLAWAMSLVCEGMDGSAPRGRMAGPSRPARR
jgi:hypothetical protein